MTPILTPSEQITARLAGIDPSGVFSCFFCGYGHEKNCPNPILDHRPDCLWRNAKEYMDDYSKNLAQLPSVSSSWFRGFADRLGKRESHG